MLWHKDAVLLLKHPQSFRLIIPYMSKLYYKYLRK